MSAAYAIARSKRPAAPCPSLYSSRAVKRPARRGHSQCAAICRTQKYAQICVGFHTACSSSKNARKPRVTIVVMNIEPLPQGNQTAQGWTTENSNPFASALRKGRMLSGKEVATMCGYTSLSAFWAWVAKERPPHVRLSARNIRFSAQALQGWLDKRDNTKGQP